MVSMNQVIQSIIAGGFTAISFIVLGMIVGALNGIIDLGVATWTILAILVVLPIIGIKASAFRLPDLLTNIGFTAAIALVIAGLFPQANFLAAPFEASVGGTVVGLIAVLLHLAGSVALGNRIRSAVKI